MKNFAKNAAKATLVLALALKIVSCSQDPIFADIEKEIKLKKFTVSNIVYAVAECDGTLYAAHGAISAKPASSHGGWSKIAQPAGKLVIGLAAGGDLFALTDNFCVWEKSGGGWISVEQKIDGVVLAIFGNGESAFASVQSADSEKSGVYSLPDFVKQDGASHKSVKCAGKEGAEGGIAFSQDHLCWTDPEGKAHADSSQILDRVASAQAAEFWSSGGKNWIAVGATSGFYLIPLDESYEISGAAVKNQPANASTTVGLYDIFPGGVWVEGDAIFAATFDRDKPKSNGLWGYYPSRGEWNKE